MTNYLVTTEHGTQIRIDTENRTVVREYSGDHPYFGADYDMRYHTFRVGPLTEPIFDSSWSNADVPVVGLAMYFQERGLSGSYYRSTTVVSVEELS